MKFPRLPVGQRFRWRGATFRKDGPLTARSDSDGSSRMIPRSAMVEVLDGTAQATHTAPAPALSGAVVDDALQDMVEHLMRAADTLGDDAAASMRAAIEAARERFVARIDQG